MYSPVPNAASLTVEFKSDVRKQISDSELALAVVCMANAEGGEIYLGVENDGRVTGLNRQRKDLDSLPARVADRTDPPVMVKARLFMMNGHRTLVISIPKSRRVVQTSEGVIKRRRIGFIGQPECVRIPAYEFAQRHAQTGQLDATVLPVPEASLDDLLDEQRARLRSTVREKGGDQALLRLSHEELDRALRLTVDYESRRVPTVAGLLMIGRQSAIIRHIPAHEVALQHLEGQRVRHNEILREPLLRLFERVQEFYSARVMEEELMLGLYRVPVPNVDKGAFRECVVNALMHRDYFRLGAVHVRWNRRSVKIGNPGGFVDGIRLSKLLHADPIPRNPALADVVKQIGLAERTGRGIDLIYAGQLRFGRYAPDYSRSDGSRVSVELSSAAADLLFFRFVLDQESKLGTRLPVDTLLILSHLRRAGSAATGELADLIQQPPFQARQVAEHLVESGLVRSIGSGQEYRYTLSSSVNAYFSTGVEVPRHTGPGRKQRVQLVMALVNSRGHVRRKVNIR